MFFSVISSNILMESQRVFEVKTFWKLRRLASQKGRNEARIELEAHRFAALPALKPGSPGSAP